MREVCRNGRSYLPLEAFRAGQTGGDVPGKAAFRTFLSSGTTSANRSRSRYSEEGLSAYRSGSLTAFKAMLKRAAVGPLDIARGVSLIPPVEAWPDSSLAQMVAWIGETMPLQYVTGETLAAAIADAADEPLFVFGTAFHFVHLLDSGFRAKLPSGSLIVETGGTKGKSRSISREDLYAELAVAFGISEDRIISEYGMCELASQAYGRDKLRFPNWVKVSVLTGPGRVAASGRGALIVDDPQRLDVGMPIRTEDLVELETDGSFRLLGRLDSAPLKGCSLLAEDVAPQSTPATAPGDPVIAQGDVARAKAFLDFFDEFLASPLAHRALAREFGSDAAATAALEDLAVSAPGTVDEWLAATTPRETPKHWLLVLPENHSLVGIYPLALGYVLGLDLKVRLPRRFEAESSFLRLFLASLAKAPGANLGTLPASFRIGEQPVDAGGVLLYGSDETVAALRALLPGRVVQGFGNRTGVTAFAASDIPGLVRDALSLGQRGCLATRVAVTSDRTLTEDALASAIAREGARFWDAPLDWRTRVGLDGAALALQDNGFRVHEQADPAAPLVATRVVPSFADVTPELLRAAVSQHPFVIPVLVVKEQVTPAFVKAAVEESPLTKSRYRGLSFRDVGEANRPTWDGSHETTPLFSPY